MVEDEEGGGGGVGGGEAGKGRVTGPTGAVLQTLLHMHIPVPFSSEPEQECPLM